MTKKRKSSPEEFIKRATQAVNLFKFLVRAAGVSLKGTLFVVALVNIVAVVLVGKCKYGELPMGEGDGDPAEWWLLGGATGVSMAAIWISILKYSDEPRFRTAGKIALAVVVAALGVVIHVGDLDPEPLLQLMNAMI